VYADVTHDLTTTDTAAAAAADDDDDDDDDDKPALVIDESAATEQVCDVYMFTTIVYSQTAWVVSTVPWVRTPCVKGQLWRAPTASVGGE